MNKIILVSHQIPWIYDPKAKTFDVRPGHEAVFAGSQYLGSKFTTVHIGCIREGCTAETKAAYLKEKQSIIVDIDAVTALGHYEGYCKNELWPLFHYILWDNATDGLVESENYSHYKRVNELFSEAVLGVYEPGNLIWIQDYHLMLLPSLLRHSLPKSIIGFFLHTPFPSSEVFRCLPKRSEILSGVLGANLVGFQSYNYGRHFISSCTRVIGCESSPSGVDFHGFSVSIGIFPVGINLERLETILRSTAVQQKINYIENLFDGKKMIIGRDTMDHVKGIQHKLAAFEKFLELYPEWHNKIVLIQVTSTNIENPNIASKISDSISRINGRYGSLAYVPIHHYHHRLDPEEYYALMTIADCALITPLRDGMNTTSHEFIICQEKNKGSLILSEFAGSANAMAGATLVNPWDVTGVAHAINLALVRGREEKELKHYHLYRYVTNNTADRWADQFVRELNSATTFKIQSNPTPYLDFEKTVDCYRKATKKRLLLFDYDGTLTPIVKVPKDAHPPPRMLVALALLAADPMNVVFVISGREQERLDEWLGHIKGLGLSAEHGSFIKYPGNEWINLAAELDLAWKQEVAEIFEYYTERTQGSFVEHKKYSITWHYRLADPEYGVFQAKECQLHLEEAIMSKLPVEVMVGKKNLEVTFESNDRLDQSV